MEDKDNIKQIHQIISYAPQYMSALMRLLTTPTSFFTTEFAKEKATKDAMAFLSASFVVAAARILYGHFSSLSDMESSLRWDSVISFLFIVGGLAILIYMLLHAFRSSMNHDQCLVCAIYFMGAIFIFMALPYSICMPLLNEVTQAVSQIIVPTQQLTDGKFYFLEIQLLFMIVIIVGSLVLWPLYLFWGIGRAGGLGVIRNFGFTTVMYAASLIIAAISFLGTGSLNDKPSAMKSGSSTMVIAK